MSAKEHIRVAMIGAGGMASRVHYPSLASFGDVTIAAACDLDQGRLKAVADQYEIAGRYTDYRRMVEEVAPDAIYAIGQPHQLYDAWTWCLQHGINLYIEKPLGLSIHQAQMLRHLAEQNGCITQVSFQRRSTPMVVKLLEACRERGPIVHAVCRFYKNEIRPMTGPRDHMLDDGVHAIDTLRWICGGEVVGIESSIKRIGVPDINFFTATLHFDTGATGIMLASWSSGRRIFAVEMHAPGICAEAGHEQQGVLCRWRYTRVTFDTRKVAGSDELFIYGGFQAKHREFIDCLKAGTQPSSNFADALKTMEVAEKILAQALLRS